MSLADKLKSAWDSFRGRGPAATVALSLDLGTARDKTRIAFAGGALVVEKCQGDLTAYVGGPNGDGLNLRTVRVVEFPFGEIFLTNTAQSGLSARLLLIPDGMKVSLKYPHREDLISLGSVVTIGAGAGVQVIAGAAGKQVKVYDAGLDALTAGLHYFYFGTSTTPSAKTFCTRQTGTGPIRQSFSEPRISAPGEGLYVYSAVAETSLPYDLGYVQE